MYAKMHIGKAWLVEDITDAKYLFIYFHTTTQTLNQPGWNVFDQECLSKQYLDSKHSKHSKHVPYNVHVQAQ